MVLVPGLCGTCSFSTSRRCYNFNTPAFIHLIIFLGSSKASLKMLFTLSILSSDRCLLRPTPTTSSSTTARNPAPLHVGGRVNEAGHELRLAAHFGEVTLLALISQCLGAVVEI